VIVGVSSKATLMFAGNAVRLVPSAPTATPTSAPAARD
jgi:hypothetical protein